MLRRLSENRVAMSDFFLQEFYKNVEATKSERLRAILDEQLEEYRKYFEDVRPRLMDGRNVQLYEDRIELIRREIGLRRVPQ